MVVLGDKRYVNTEERKLSQIMAGEEDQRSFPDKGAKFRK